MTEDDAETRAVTTSGGTSAPVQGSKGVREDLNFTGLWRWIDREVATTRYQICASRSQRAASAKLTTKARVALTEARHRLATAQRVLEARVVIGETPGGK